IWRQARWLSWKADTLAGDAKKNMGKATWQMAERAVKAAPALPEGHYYAALGIGQYSEGAGIINALAEGLEGKFNERLDKAISINGSIDNGGPMVLKGRYFFTLPWPMRNLNKSSEWFNKALAKHPYNLRAHLYLAETMLKDGKAKDAKPHLDLALTG